MEILLYLKEILELTNFRENNIDISSLYFEPFFVLQTYTNKNERQSYDYLPLSTQDNSVLELFYKDLHLLYDLKNAFEHEGIDNYFLNFYISERVKTNP